MYHAHKVEPFGFIIEYDWACFILTVPYELPNGGKMASTDWYDFTYDQKRFKYSKETGFAEYLKSEMIQEIFGREIINEAIQELLYCSEIARTMCFYDMNEKVQETTNV